MLFNSLGFVLFFCVVFGVQRLLKHRTQNLFLLAASLFFYGSWNVTLLWLIVGSATIDYVVSLRIVAATLPGVKKRWLTVSIVANLGLLGYFKYAGFFVANFAALMHSIGFDVGSPTLEIILPVGISFYTFQSMSYSIDVYRGKQQPCRRYFDFLLYVSFFPQLVAGPIERAACLLPQIENPRERLRLGDAIEGTKLIVVGIVQKVLIADGIARHVDLAYANPGRFDSLTLLLSSYAFAIQVYGDFSGYSKMARGVARLIGFKLSRNFEEPHLSPNITAFWQRWHITLSTWLRDYLYIPLGGNRHGPRRTYVNLVLTMLLGGLWHGASWNTVLWGGLHGIFLAVHKLMGRGKNAASSGVRWALAIVATFHLHAFSLIVFRTQSLEDTATYFGRMLQFTAKPALSMLEILAYLVACFALDVVLRYRARKHLLILFSRNWIVETCLVATLVAIALLVGETHVIPFFYFQF